MMGLKQVRKIFQQAKDEKRAIAAYDTVNYSYMDWAVEAAQKYGAPMILMYYPHFREVITFDEFVGFQKILQKKYSVPILSHLDHSKSFEEIQAAIEAGFDSVMIDASLLPFEENVAITKKVVDYAHSADVMVEAELGKVGSANNVSDFKDPSLYTSVEEAKKFVALTGTDLLAVAIGNSHGVYVETPHLAISLLKELAAAVDVPLVLHGTSLIPEDQVAEAVANGICKVNLCTEMLIEVVNAVEKTVKDGIEGQDRIFFMERAIKDKVMPYFDAKVKLLGNY